MPASTTASLGDLPFPEVIRAESRFRTLVEQLPMVVHINPIEQVDLIPGARGQVVQMETPIHSRKTMGQDHLFQVIHIGDEIAHGKLGTFCCDSVGTQ